MYSCKLSSACFRTVCIFGSLSLIVILFRFVFISIPTVKILDISTEKRISSRNITSLRRQQDTKYQNSFHPPRESASLSRFSPAVMSKEFSSEQCKPKELSYLKEKPKVRVALVSFPGSGNTWLRHLVQELTGKNSKSDTHLFVAYNVTGWSIILRAFGMAFQWVAL